MLKKVGDTAIISLLVTTSVNDLTLPVTDDTPYVTVKNITTNKYYNGLTWQDNPFHLYMSYVSNGIYIYRWLVLMSGSFEIVSKSTLYPLITSTTVITSYSDSDTPYPWIITEPHIVTFASGADASECVVSIRDSNQHSWNGQIFVSEEVFLPMTKPSPEDVIFTYSIQFPQTDKYVIYAKNANVETDYLLYTLNAVASETDIVPIEVTSDNLVSLDSTNSILIDENQNPLSNVEVAAYNTVTKALVNKTFTGSDGSWSLMLRPGRYTFMFTKAGYESEGFERVVN